jgi:hypothetical protein
MSEEQTNFKVTDRRLFNPDGTPRELPPEEKPPEAAKPLDAAKPTEQPSSQQSPQAAAAAQESSPSTAASDQAAEEDEFEEPDARDPASFINFMMSIASNAASAVGMMEHPVTHEREVDLELAKHWIDVLGMLQHKTRGNLSSQEQKILEGLLSDLRMQFVSLTNSPQVKTARPFTGRDIIGGK